MRNTHESFIMHSITSFVASGLTVIALAVIALAGCERSIELEQTGIMPDIGIYGMAARGDLVYAVTETEALLVVDISTPEQPEVVGRLPGDVSIAYMGADIALGEDRAYTVPDMYTMRIVDISQPSQPVELGQYQTTAEICDMVIREPYAYVVGAGLPLLVIDISVPETPVLVGELITPGGSYALALSGDHAFIADHVSGLFVADISDPTAPRAVATNPEVSGAIDIEVRGDHAYLVIQGAGFATMDISKPDATRVIGFVKDDFLERLALGNDDVVYASTVGTVASMDVSDPFEPRSAGVYEFTNFGLWITSMVSTGEHVVVGRLNIPVPDPMAGDLTVLTRKE